MALLLIFCTTLAIASWAQEGMPTQPLMLYGGPDHKVFLGCLNCSAQSRLSVCNTRGDFGSLFQPDSIWNEFGRFGSEFRKDSPWNSSSQTAPLIMDGVGTSHGYFSVNELHRDRTGILRLLNLLSYARKHTSDLPAVRNYYCGSD